MKKAIVTFATGDRYQALQQRQEQSLKAVGWDGDYFAFKTFESIGSPHHDDVPYAFKPYAIKAVKDMGYDLVLWIDSPIYATKNLDVLFNSIDEYGIILFDNIGYTIGDYTSDDCLNLMSMTREQAFSEKMIMACAMGFNFTHERTNSFFDSYYNSTKIEGIYEGDWNNDNGQVSSDPRVHGHRHDQSAASIIAAKMNLLLLSPHNSFLAYFGNTGHLPHSQGVCLISKG